ncbi:MAG: alpha/beta hydrolase [Actinomycetia bacterium]|nr:alpha/beta hydrolase [Actinomycetes bacterium]MCP4224489.1 alpha/beta hydrolase [Actinomycetes bacterium]MCP5031148.1 alpha/beta hydrolase [Actinomycetes bacterium]
MSGNPVLLLHGFTTSANRTWREPGWIDLLTDAGREVIAPDLLGHGDSPKPHDPAEYARVEELVNEILPEGPIDGVGYSAGARILLYLASQGPERFGRLVVGGIGGRMFEELEGNPILDALEGRAGEEDMVASHFKSMAEGDGNDPKALAAFIKRDQPPLERDDLARITNPTLVVIGDKDFAGPGEPLADALPAGEVLTLPGVDHFGLPKAFPFLEQGLDFLGAAPF